MAVFGFFFVPADACTIFVLTDATHALFCNNEDWVDPKSRISFVPAGPTNLGCVYVGFNDGIPQGGMNTKGLAFDWVAGVKETWNSNPSLPGAFGCRQMLETCATVGEASAFFRSHRELGFYTSRMLVADRTGASAIIGTKDGKLHFATSNESRGFGYGERNLDLGKVVRSARPTVSNGAKLLRACLQKGLCATKYSNVFDLRAGDIFLFPVPERRDQVRLDLAAELKKGGHYYEMHRIREQLDQPSRPLLPKMERCLLEKYKPIPDQEPEVTAHERRIIEASLAGTMQPDDYTPEGWNEEKLAQTMARPIMNSFGRPVSLTLVDRSQDGAKRSYRYRVELARNTLLQELVFDEHNKLASSQIEDVR